MPFYECQIKFDFICEAKGIRVKFSSGEWKNFH